jgi:hypothetical protein
MEAPPGSRSRMSDEHELPAARPPDDSADVKQVRRPRAAGGLGAIAATTAHVTAGPGLARDDRYRGVSGRHVVFMNEEDIAALGLTAGMRVDITSRWRDETRRVSRFVVVPYPIPRGSAAAYFPEANPLVPLGQFAPGSRTPASKSIVVELTASAP